MQFCGQMPFCTAFNSRRAMEEAKKKLEEEDEKLAAKCQFHQNGAKLEVGKPPKTKTTLNCFLVGRVCHVE